MSAVAARADTLGLVLAGGRSRRMGGADKALLRLAGRPLLAHALARLGPQCGALALSANADPSVYAAFAPTVLKDATPDFPGPLAGVLAGLEHAARTRAPFVASMSVDTPFLPRDFVARLHAALGEADIAVAASGGRTHWTSGLWRATLADDLRARLRAGARRAEDFVRGHSFVVVAWDAAARDPFFNVNTPEDLDAAARMAT
mgnify:CR=1 FL=1